MLHVTTYYDTLKVTRDAPAIVIQAACRALMQLNHPDNFEGREYEAVKIAEDLREAFDVLIDPNTRAQYDNWLAKQMEQSN
ncbi:DnaJ domain-containing protein [Methylomonas sp. LL1]|uniref:J domain-containing protein n=1 Tax=Methylomonas sp. LL1 TaxID=2785785 RepID=UPI0018C3F9AA|nr:DnaJ domain-containing protein [Methylomonas sp. LL1]QPK62465.1 DnaJ domain-containing protein [Methylomonas sp. LL1]